MPYKPPNSPYWYATYTDAAGKRIRQSTGTADRKEAVAIEAKFKLEAHKKKHFDVEPERLFDAAMLAFLEAHRHKKSADRDVSIVRTHLIPAFSGKPINNLGAKAIRDYVDGRRASGAAAGTINRELALLSAALNFAATELEWKVSNPVAGRKLPTPEGRVRRLTADEEARLLDAVAQAKKAPWLLDFVILALNTGMRRGEMLKLPWDRVDMDARLIHLGAADTKSARRRSVPINAGAMDALANRAAFRRQHCPDTIWVFCAKDGSRVASVRKGFEAAVARAGIEDFRIHDLRHTCASNLVSRGAQPLAVKELLGHSSLAMTERYAHLSPDNVKAAVKLLED